MPLHADRTHTWAKGASVWRLCGWLQVANSGAKGVNVRGRGHAGEDAYFYTLGR